MPQHPNAGPPQAADADSEIRALALQLARKPGGFGSPSRINQAAPDAAMDQVEATVRALLRVPLAMAAPRGRESQPAKAMAAPAQRLGGARG